MTTNIFSLKRFESYLLLAIILITLAVYSPVAWHDFINYDDDVFVYENLNIKDGITLAGIRWAFTSAHEVNWIPLTWISHMLDVQLFGMNPAGHHVVNVLLHTGSTVLLFLFLRRATAATWQSLTVAILFALHPLHVESVAWVAERKDVLSAFFGMLTLYAYVCYAEKSDLRTYAITLFLFLLGLLSKPMLVTLPVVLLLLDWWPLGRLFNSTDGVRARPYFVLAEKIPFFILSICSSVVTYMVQEAEGELFHGYTFMSRAGKACIAYVTYLHKMVWPVKLAILYPFSKYPPSTAKIFVACTLLMVITVLVFWFGRRYPYLITGWAWYIVTLLPVIGVIQIGQHSVADRYTYIPLIGVFIMIAWGIPRLLNGWKYRDVFVAVASALILVVMIVITTIQLRHWKNAYTLFSHTVEVTEGNWVAHNNLGLVFLSDGNTDEAIRHFKESIRSKPSYALAYLNLGAAYLARGDYEQAVESFKWSIQFDRANPKAHNGLGAAYSLLGKRELALSEYQFLVDLRSPLASMLLEQINMPVLNKTLK